MDVQASTPEALQKFLVGEIARWGKVVKDNNIRAD
jgi:tripartite-type tricarboxylate transporter receptor subunit TctC